MSHSPQHAHPTPRTHQDTNSSNTTTSIAQHGPAHTHTHAHDALAAREEREEHELEHDHEHDGAPDDAYYARKRAALRRHQQQKGKGKPKLHHASPGVTATGASPALSARSGRDDEGVQSYLRSAIGALPLEVLVRAFSYLDVRSLARCAQVCPVWAALLADDGTWRAAFVTRFGLQDEGERESEAGAGAAAAPALRRVSASSWRREYGTRASLLRVWRKARSPTVLTDARIGVVSRVALCLPQRLLLSASSLNGAAALQDPFFGRVARPRGAGGAAGPGGAGAGAGAAGAGAGGGAVTALGPGALEALPGAGPSHGVTVCALDADGSRALWGFADGSVRATLYGRAAAAAAIWPGAPAWERPLTRSILLSGGAGAGSHAHAHAGPVADVALACGSERGGVRAPQRTAERAAARAARVGPAVAALAATAGEDGTARLWCVRSARLVWMGDARKEVLAHSDAARGAPSAATASASGPGAPRSAPVRPLPLAKVDYDPASGTVAAAARDGTLVLWRGLGRGLAHALGAQTRAGGAAGGPGAGVGSSAAASAGSAASASAMPAAQAEQTAVIRVRDARTNAQPQPPVDLLLDAGAYTPAGGGAGTGTGADGEERGARTTLLVRFEGDDGFWRVDVAWPALAPPAAEASDASRLAQVTVTTTRFASTRGAITCLRADFDVEKPSSSGSGSGSGGSSHSAARSLLVRAAPHSSAYASTSAAAAGAADGDVPTLVLGPSAAELRAAEKHEPLQERKFVAAGTEYGAVLLYPWDVPAGVAAQATGESPWAASTLAAPPVQPSLRIAVGSFSVTALDFTAAFLLCGSSDGSVKVFELLTGELVRTFADRAATRHPARMLASGALTQDEARRFHVSQIVAADNAFVAVIGSHVLAWRCDEVPGAGAGGRRFGGTGGSSKATGGRSRRQDARYYAQGELEQEVLEGTQSARTATAELQHRQQWQRAAVLDDLSEQEAVAYALMLSRDQLDAERQQARAHGAGSAAAAAQDDDDELQAALDAIARSEARERLARHAQSDSEDSERLDRDDSWRRSRASSRSPSPSPSASASASRSASASASASPRLASTSAPGRAWEILAHAGPSACSTTDRLRGAGANGKVQTVRVPRAARSGRSPAGADLDADAMDLSSPHDWPSVSPELLSTSHRSSSVASSLSLSLSHSPSRWHPHSQAHSPFHGPASPPPAAPASLAPHWARMHAATSPPAAAAPAAPYSSSPARGAWGAGSPLRRPSSGAGAGARAGAGGGGAGAVQQQADAVMDEDEQLRVALALSLSLAEERERNAAAGSEAS